MAALGVTLNQGRILRQPQIGTQFRKPFLQRSAQEQGEFAEIVPYGEGSSGQEQQSGNGQQSDNGQQPLLRGTSSGITPLGGGLAAPGTTRPQVTTTTPIVPGRPAPTMGPAPQFEMPEYGEIPSIGEMPTMELPEYGEVPEFEMPEGMEMPTFVAPEREEGVERKYVQEAAGAGIRELRRTQRETMARQYENPMVEARVREGVLRGSGDALSQIMSVARQQGGAKAEREYQTRFDVAKTNYQGAVTKAGTEYQTRVVKAQRQHDAALRKIEAQFQAGTIKSQAEYNAKISDRQMKWQAETQKMRDVYNAGMTKAQLTFQAKQQATLTKFEREYAGYLAEFGQETTTGLAQPKRKLRWSDLPIRERPWTSLGSTGYVPIGMYPQYEEY